MQEELQQPPEPPGLGRPLHSADRAHTSRFMLPGPAGQWHKVGHRSAVPSCCPSPQAVEAGQGAGHGRPRALRQLSQGGWAWAAPLMAVWMWPHPYPQPQFPHLYRGVQPHSPSIREALDPWIYPEMGQEGTPVGRGAGRGLQSTRDGPWRLFSGKRWGGNLQTLCAGPLGRTGQTSLGPCLQEAPDPATPPGHPGPALGLAPQSPIAHVRGLRLGPGYYSQSQSWEAACRVAVGFETSHEPLPQRQHPLPWP